MRFVSQDEGRWEVTDRSIEVEWKGRRSVCKAAGERERRTD